MTKLANVVCVSIVVCLVMAQEATVHADWGSTSAAGTPATEHAQSQLVSDSNSGNSSQTSGDSSQSDSGQSSDSNSGDSNSGDSSQSDSGQSSDSNSGDSNSGESSDSNSGESSDSNSGGSDSGESSNSGSGDSGSGDSKSASSDGDGGNTDPNANNPTGPGDETSTDSANANPLLGLATLSSSVGAAIGVYFWLSWEEAPQPAREQALEMYLRQNAVAFASDAGSGAGPVVDDLAAMFGVSPANHSRFGRVLRRLYPKLKPVVAELRDDQGASRRFVSLVIDAMRDDARLEIDLASAGLLKLTVHVRTLARTSQGQASKG